MKKFLLGFGCKSYAESQRKETRRKIDQIYEAEQEFENLALILEKRFNEWKAINRDIELLKIKRDSAYKSFLIYEHHLTGTSIDSSAHQ